MTRNTAALSIILILLFLALAVIAFAMPAGADSLRGVRSASLFSDHKARGVGDVVTVIIVQQTVSQHKEASLVDRLTARIAAVRPNGLLPAEDADLAQAVVDLKTQENIYDASAAAAARIGQLTLLDYLR